MRNICTAKHTQNLKYRKMFAMLRIVWMPSTSQARRADRLHLLKLTLHQLRLRGTDNRLTQRLVILHSCQKRKERWSSDTHWLTEDCLRGGGSSAQHASGDEPMVLLTDAAPSYPARWEKHQQLVHKSCLNLLWTGQKTFAVFTRTAWT